MHLTHLGGPPYQFLAQTGHPVAQKMNGAENQGPNFSNFPIQMAENCRKRPNFDGPYLGNRLELVNASEPILKRRYAGPQHVLK